MAALRHPDGWKLLLQGHCSERLPANGPRMGRNAGPSTSGRRATSESKAITPMVQAIAS